MNNKLKTLTLITTGLVVGVVVGRVGKLKKTKTSIDLGGLVISHDDNSGEVAFKYY